MHPFLFPNTFILAIIISFQVKAKRHLLRKVCTPFCSLIFSFLFIVCNTVIAPDFKKFGDADIKDLCEYVGAVIPAQWKNFGRFVGVDNGQLQAITAGNAGKPHSQQDCFTDVFTRWHDSMTSDFTWEKAAEALTSNAVGSRWLLETLYKKLEARK